jgi:hypothetical protein
VTEQPPLPDMPAPPARHAPAGRSGERISRYSTKARRVCDACAFLIHRYGQAGAPYPRQAKWRVSTDEKSWYLCGEHRESRF